MMTSLCACFTGLIRRWTFLTRVVGAALMLSTMPFGLFRNRHGLKGFFFLHLGRGVQVRFAKIALCWSPRRLSCSCGRSFRRQAGGDVFRALDLLGVAALIDLVLRGLVADHLGARLDGFAIGAAVGYGPGRRWGGSACLRGVAGKNFCHSY